MALARIASSRLLANWPLPDGDRFRGEGPRGPARRLRRRPRTPVRVAVLHVAAVSHRAPPDDGFGSSRRCLLRGLRPGDRAARRALVDSPESRRQSSPATAGDRGRNLSRCGAAANGAPTLAGRWMAFRAADLLPGNSRVHVSVGPGVPSREGPRKSTKRDDWTLDTYGPLVVRESGCEASGVREGCSPGVPWRIELSNPIDRDAFREELVHVEPAIEGMSVSAHGSFICIRGLPKPRTLYRVVVAPAVRDVFGGRLGRDGSFTFKTGDFAPVLLGPFLNAPDAGSFILDPAGGPHLTVHSAGLKNVHVQLRAVRPEQWKEFEGDRWEHRKLPGRVVAEWTEHPVSPDGGLVATKIDLDRGLHDGAGQLLRCRSKANRNESRRVAGLWTRSLPGSRSRGSESTRRGMARAYSFARHPS